MFKIILAPEVEIEFDELCKDPAKRPIAKAVTKALKYMCENIRHASLHTHKYDDFIGPTGEEVFESYAQNKTPGAYRIFWFYGPKKREITIIAITPHPN